MAKCGKRCFATKEEARAAMRAVPESKTGLIPVRVYRCGKCRAFHYTSKART